MDYNTYKILHVVGLVLLMLGLGAILGAGREAAKARRFGGMLHGLGLLVMVVAGFGMMARLEIMGVSTWPMWLIAKMAIWVVVAILPVLVKKQIVPGAIGWLLAAALAATAAWLALTKPF
jgi:uncharacterized membrane protein SirB2